MRKIKQVVFILLTSSIFGCGHSHEHSETMKEVIELNTGMWKELNELKVEVNVQLKQATSYEGELDSLAKVERGILLTKLASQKKRLKELDALIPELEGYEPKCTHEEGEPHTHHTVDVAGISEADLLSIHKELKLEIDKVKNEIK